MMSFTVDGTEDQWLLLARVSREDQPLVVRTRDNADLFDHAERSGLAVVRGRIGEGFLTVKGMPCSSISDDLYAWEDELNAEIEAQGVEAFALAVINGDGRKDLVFATADVPGLTRCVGKVPVPSMLEAEVESVADMLAWLSLVRATELDKQMDGDWAVMRSMEEHGDDGIVSRKIDFWFYGDRPKLQLLLSELEQEGFTLEWWLDDPDGLRVSLETPATREAFDALTPRLVALASSHGVTYDGWESVVVAEPAADEGRGGSIFSRLFGSKND